MPSPYDADAFQTRVNFAASYISSGRPSTRHFDTCFEMYDGTEVCAALLRRVKRNPTSKLAQNFSRYLAPRAEVEPLTALTPRQLAEHAARTRAESEANHQKWLRDLEAKKAA